MSVTEATVSKVEKYGLYLDTPLGPAIVLIPDVSQEPITDLTQCFSPGDQVKVKLLHFVEEKTIYKATMLGI